ncbi:peptidoglycan DD-metalloendopeptidase family protein [Zavarzinia compransoris]|uniref:murein hydrolase activator EnvC family protein n=1 Tax=Zavarzinia marina TaxID=2911065 RepID=UPI001F274FAF|nr:peptidoglycan DD-metalloendopeptidase family protein [Zavarzinia marina]MCF4166977.1 peptidoglycan DD-metalloendopeptidase family protein [Zavarzinia marina]
MRPRRVPAPDARRRHAFLLLLAAGVFLGGVENGLGQEADPSKLRAVQAELEDARRRQAEVEAEKARLAREIDSLKTQLVERAAQLREREAAADTIERRMAELAASEAEKTAALADRRAALSRLLGALTRLSRRPPVLLMVRRQNALDIAHTGTVLRDLLPELRDRANALGRDLTALAALRARLAVERGSLEDTLAALAVERAELDRLLGRKATDDKRLAGLAAAESRRVDRLAAEAKSIEELIAAVEKQRRAREAAEAAEAARRAAERAAAVAAATPPGEQAVPVPAEAPRPAILARFATLKGKLPLPAAGEIVARFGDRQANGLTARGFRIATRAGAGVTAPAAGSVAFAGAFSGYGQLLILSQGDGYHLLLAGMERIDVTVGQKVLAGEPVGQMEGAAEGSRPVLYIELRHDGAPVDLGPWLSPRATKVSG